MKNAILALPLMVLTFFGTAYAAVPAAVTTSISDGQTDAITVAGLVVAALIAVAVFSWMRRAAK